MIRKTSPRRTTITRKRDRTPDCLRIIFIRLEPLWKQPELTTYQARIPGAAWDPSLVRRTSNSHSLRHTYRSSRAYSLNLRLRRNFFTLKPHTPCDRGDPASVHVMYATIRVHIPMTELVTSKISTFCTLHSQKVDCDLCTGSISYSKVPMTDFPSSIDGIVK